MPSKNSITELVEQLTEQLRQTQEIARAEEERAVAAEKKAAEMHGEIKVLEEKLEVLKVMKQGAYQTVVTELFKEPSKKAFRVTVIVALLSILAGLMQSFAFNWNADINQAKTVDRLAQSLKTQISEEIDKSKQFTAEQITRINQEEQNSRNLPGAELRNGIPVDFTVAKKEARIFRVTVPENTAKLKVVLTNFTKDTDLSVRYDELPGTKVNTNSKSQNQECGSAKLGTSEDTCTIDSPLAGNWFVRIWGFDGPAPVKLQVIF